MESPKFEKTSQAEKVALFLEKWRTVLIVVLALVIAVIVGVSIFNAVHSSNDKAVIGEVDKIAYELTENSAKLSSEELEVRRENALSKLKPYLSKGCVGGSAANRLQKFFIQKKITKTHLNIIFQLQKRIVQLTPVRLIIIMPLHALKLLKIMKMLQNIMKRQQNLKTTFRLNALISVLAV